MSESFSNPLIFGLFALICSIVPVLVLMITPFLKLSIVFGVLRIGFGSQGVPGPGILGVLALVLSIYSTAPLLMTIAAIGKESVPTVDPRRGSKKEEPAVFIDWLENFASRISRPIEERLRPRSGTREVEFFRSRAPAGAPILFVLIPAYALTELRTGFSMAVYLFMPFLVVDLLVTTVLTGMGMMMVNPVTISFPLKLLLFVGCDGWLQLTTNLLESYRT